ncbi:hypothetical protein B1A99_25170 [Cohnella sp. CIP 111063]|nr:hypothetical protein B1A99_25170 [Cohnella sp. CIP 111063]PRX65204.1 PrgI family protein [Cohnella sp. SGD-V74]
MPFDTEKERKPLKVLEMSFSWRQVAYLSVSLLACIQLIQYTYVDSFPLVMNIIIIVLDLLIFVPAIVFGFIKNEATALFLDRYLTYYLRHEKRESGLWRR